MLKIMIVLLGIVIVPMGFAADSPEIRALRNDMPPDVSAMIERTVECNRWEGEEPTLKERIERVKKELETWKCDAIENDRAALTKKYQTNYEIKSRLQKAKDIY